MNVTCRFFKVMILLLLTISGFVAAMQNSSSFNKSIVIRMDVDSGEDLKESTSLSGSFSSDESAEKDQLIDMIDLLESRLGYHIDSEKFIKNSKKNFQKIRLDKHLSRCTYEGSCSCLAKEDQDKLEQDLAASALKTHFLLKDPAKKYFLIIQDVFKITKFISELSPDLRKENSLLICDFENLRETHKNHMKKQVALFDEKALLRLIWLLIGEFLNLDAAISLESIAYLTSSSRYKECSDAWLISAKSALSGLSGTYKDSICTILWDQINVDFAIEQ